jgi:8-oxo-dGTP diphosphatase
MDERHFLEGYDDTRYRHPSVTVDLVLLTVKDGTLRALLHRRAEHPERNKWALPGGFVGFKESLDDAARRVARDKAGIKIAYLEQLYTFGAVARDPRTRVITVAYFGLLPVQQFEKATAPELAVARIATNWSGETGGPAKAFDKADKPLALAFDHADILGLTIKRLRGKIDYSRVGFELLPRHFTLRQLQDIYEAILDKQLNKPAFRRRMLDKSILEPTGLHEQGASFRPAELYRFTKSV